MKKNTLTKLVALATVLLVSVGTIAGSTVAWFTDTEYAINTIQSGSLDIGLEYWGPTVNEDDEETIGWADVKSDTPIFKQGALYEPGYTEVVYLKVSNLGDLDLKYKLAVQAADTQTGESLIEDPVEKNTVLELSDYLKVAAFEVVKAKADENSEATFETAIENWNKATENGDGTTTSARAKVRAEIEDTVSNLNPDENTSIPFLSKGTALKDSKGEPVENKEGFPIYEVDLFKNEDGSAKTFNLLAKKEATNTTEAVAAGENVIGLVLYMPEEVGNEANNRGANKPEIEIGIFLEATQLVSESDSYGSDYDTDAQFANTNLYTADRTTSSDNTTTGGTTLEPEEFIVDGIIYRTIVENELVLEVVEVAGYDPDAEIPDTVTIGRYIDGDSASALGLATYLYEQTGTKFEGDTDISIWRVREAAWPEGIESFELGSQSTMISSKAFPTGSTIVIDDSWMGYTNGTLSEGDDPDIASDAFGVDVANDEVTSPVVHFIYDIDHETWNAIDAATGETTDGQSYDLKYDLNLAGYEAGKHYTMEFNDGWVINKGAEDPMPARIENPTEVTVDEIGTMTTVKTDATNAYKVTLAGGVITSSSLPSGVSQLELPSGTTSLRDRSLSATADPFVLIASADTSIAYPISEDEEGIYTGIFGKNDEDIERFFIYKGDPVTNAETMQTLWNGTGEDWNGLASQGFDKAYYYDEETGVYTLYAPTT